VCTTCASSAPFSQHESFLPAAPHPSFPLYPHPSFPRKRESTKGTAVTKQPALYILASRPNGTLYTGVTSDLLRRVWEHRSGLVEGFTERYRVHHLVYFEFHDNIEDAIRREKQIKKWRRAWKIDLIEESNPRWRDLWPTIIGGEEMDSRESWNDLWKACVYPHPERAPFQTYSVVPPSYDHDECLLSPSTTVRSSVIPAKAGIQSARSSASPTSIDLPGYV
jgi:putative endonuclease